MDRLDPPQTDLIPVGVPSTAAQSERRDAMASRTHLVVVTTRELGSPEATAASGILRTRFWHPRDRLWSENDFDSLEHAMRLFVDESGWVLRQDQALDAPMSREWIFEAHRIDFTRPTREQILREVGLTPESVTRLLEDVKDHHHGESTRAPRDG